VLLWKNGVKKEKVLAQKFQNYASCFNFPLLHD